MKNISDFIRILKNGGPVVWKVIAAFLLLDFIFIAIYVIYGMLDVVFDADKMPDFWDLAKDHSASEIFNYIKWLFICTSLTVAFLRTRVMIFLSFAFVFALVLLDDMLQIHERGGVYFVQMFEFLPSLGLRAQDFGELATWAMLGSISMVALIWGYLRSPVSLRPFGSYFFVILCGLVFTAMGLDMINALDVFKGDTAFANTLTGILTIAEDGGEMIVGSFGCGGAVAVLTANHSKKRQDAGFVADNTAL